MKKVFIGIVFAGIILAMTGSSFAQSELMVFPKDGQSREVQAKDTTYCKSWAKSESGVDPSYVRAKIEMQEDVIRREAQSGQQSTGGRLFRGAARGAAIGAVGSNVDNNVGKRAIQGGMMTGMRSRDERKKAEHQQRVGNEVHRQEQFKADYSKYIRAYSVCMDAKGYSVK